jgi:hypothetical protein
MQCCFWVIQTNIGKQVTQFLTALIDTNDIYRVIERRHYVLKRTAGVGHRGQSELGK